MFFGYSNPALVVQSEEDVIQMVGEILSANSLFGS